MRVKRNIRIVRSGRSIFDKVVLRIFSGVVSRFVSKHLVVAQEFGDINNRQFHELDAQFKGDIGRSGFKHLA